MKMLINSPSELYNLIYIDPPFNTGHKQERKTIKTVADDEGDRTGFQGKKFSTEEVDYNSYDDTFDNYVGFLRPRLEEAKRVLKANGSMFVHIDCREVHRCRLMLDDIFGSDCFMNEIIWAYDFGGRSKSKWPAKHDNILWYVKDPDNYTFNYEAMDRIPYMAPGLVGEEKAKKGKTPTDVWWHTIVPTNASERNGYPTQKPVELLARIVKVHSNPGDLLLDFFAGSGSFGEAAYLNRRNFVMVDEKKEAVEIMARRLQAANPELLGFSIPKEKNCLL